MGCFESREETKAGQITFISKDDFEKDKVEHKFVAVDCSKTDADYKFQRITGAVYFSISEWIKKDKNGKMFCQTPTVEEFSQVASLLTIGKDSSVVCYDTSDGLFASYGAYLLS